MKRLFKFSIFIVSLCGLNPGYAQPVARLTPEGNILIYRIQLSSNTSAYFANNFISELIQQGYQPYQSIDISPTGPIWYCVQIGEFLTYEDASSQAVQIRESGYPDAFIVQDKMTREQAIAKGYQVEKTIYEKAVENVNLSSINSEDGLWDRAFSTYNTVSTGVTVKVLTELIQRFPWSEKVPLAKYYLGTIYYGRYWHRYNQGIDKEAQYENLITAARLFYDIANQYADDTISDYAKLHLGYSYHALSRFGLKLPALADSVEIFGKIVNQTNDPQLKSRAQLHQINLHLEQAMNGLRSFDSVISECLSALENQASLEDEIRATIKLMLVEAYFMKKDFFSTLTTAQQLIATEPVARAQSYFAQYLIGLSLDRLGLYQQAIMEYQKLLVNYKEEDNFYGNNLHVSALFRIAGCYEELGDYMKSKDYLSEIATRYPASDFSNRAAEIMEKIDWNIQTHGYLVEKKD